MTRYENDRNQESGSVLVATLFVVVLLGGLITLMQRSTLSTLQATHRNQTETRLLYVAESGLDFEALELSKDPLSAVKDIKNFSLDQDAAEYVGSPTNLSLNGSARRAFRLRVQYSKDGVPVVFTDRTNPTESWDLLKLTSTASLSHLSRSIAGWYRLQMGEAFASAVVSDAYPKAAGGSGKGGAQNGHVVFESEASTYVFGGIRANGGIWAHDNKDFKSLNHVIDTATATRFFDGFSGTVDPDLLGTAEEVPDFTSSGGNDQLFDFDRFKAAAAAGSGHIFNSLEDFAAAVNAANAAGVPLEGIVVVNVDSIAEGSKPQFGIGPPAAGTLDIQGGINIRGTLMFSFSKGTKDSYKIFIKAPLHINAADLSSWDPADQSTYTTGYPPAYSDTTKAPWKAKISPTYTDFSEGDGLPALMFDNGVIDVHDAANICGVVYGPSFIEIENKEGKVQYISGSVIGGGGIYIENRVAGGTTAIRFDPVTLANLQTLNGRGKVLMRTGFAILK